MSTPLIIEDPAIEAYFRRIKNPEAGMIYVRVIFRKISESALSGPLRESYDKFIAYAPVVREKYPLPVQVMFAQMPDSSPNGPIVNDASKDWFGNFVFNADSSSHEWIFYVNFQGLKFIRLQNTIVEKIDRFVEGERARKKAESGSRLATRGGRFFFRLVDENTRTSYRFEVSGTGINQFKKIYFDALLNAADRAKLELRFGVLDVSGSDEEIGFSSAQIPSERFLEVTTWFQNYLNGKKRLQIGEISIMPPGTAP